MILSSVCSWGPLAEQLGQMIIQWLARYHETIDPTTP
jgi:hypothetical protein